MDSKDLIKAGKLSEARKLLIEEVKSSPGDAAKRTLLMQVLALLGQWDKAQLHLDMIDTQDPAKNIGVQVYKNLILAEKEREEVISLNKRPSFLPEQPPYFETYYVALNALLEKNIEGARELFISIEDQMPEISGTINGEHFSGISDTDTFLSAFLEAFVHERYVWIPFESIRELTINAPRTLFDLIWIQSNITTWEGLTLNCFLPVLYPETYLHDDERIKMGRMTDWTSIGGPFSRGVGQHVYQIGEKDMAILEIHDITFNASRPKPIEDGKAHD